MAVLSIGDQFPAYELTAVVPGNLKEVEASKPEDYFTTVSSLEERNLLEDADPAETRTHDFS